MQNKRSSNSIFNRSAWFMLALLVMVCWGPVKKLEELKLGKSPVSTTPTIDKKLHSGYRDRHEIKELVKSISEIAYIPATPSHALFISNYPTESSYFPLRALTKDPVSSFHIFLRQRKILV